MSNSRPELSDEERLAWLRLIRTERVGPITFHALLSRFGSAAEALAALPGLVKRSGGKSVAPPSAAQAAAEMERLAAVGGRYVALGEPDYPPALALIEDAPPLLAVKGRPDLLLDRPAIALVGARNASVSGRRIAERWARELGEAGWVVVSGLARGVDASAHQGSLRSGTIAVVAGGLDVTYPKENRALQEAIGADGLLVSECAPGAEPTARHFPRRNRIIAGIARGVVIIEAAPRSGSLITARLALEQDRAVMAVPGSPLDPRAGGANQLLRDYPARVTLVRSVDDILEDLHDLTGAVRPMPEKPSTTPEPLLAPPAESVADATAVLLECLSPTPTLVDEVIQASQLSAPVVLTALLELELAGKLERQPGNRVSLV